MNTSDRDDIRRELSRAADLQLTKDYTAQVWEQGQRHRQRTTWAIGVGVAASVAAAAVIFGQTLGGVDATQQIDPAGTVTGSPTTAEQTAPSEASIDDVAPSTDPAPSTDAEATTQAPVAADVIPLGHGVVLTPIEGWRLVHDRDLAAGADPESLEFISCVQPKGSALNPLGQCGDGVQIWTGYEGGRPELNLGAVTKELPGLGVLLVDNSLLDNGVDDNGVAADGTPGADLSMIEEALVADAGSPALTSRFLDVASVEDDVVTGEVVRFSLAQDGYVTTGESFRMTISDQTVCTEGVLSDVLDGSILCADLTARVGGTAQTPMMAVYDDDDTLWRLSEDVMRPETG